jgi:hypothetical protein
MAKVGIKTMAKLLTGKWGPGHDGQRGQETNGDVKLYEEPTIAPVPISDEALSCTSAKLDDFYAANPGDPEKAAMEFWQHMALHSGE